MVIFAPVHVPPPTTTELLQAEIFGIWEPYEFRCIHSEEDAKPIREGLDAACRRLGLEHFAIEITSSMRAGIHVSVHTPYDDDGEWPWPVMSWECFHIAYPDPDIIWRTMDRSAEHKRRKKAEEAAQAAKWQAEWEAQRNRKA